MTKHEIQRVCHQDARKDLSYKTDSSFIGKTKNESRKSSKEIVFHLITIIIYNNHQNIIKINLTS